MSIFFIDEAAFSVLLNRYHLLLHVDRDKCLAPTGLSTAQRWHRVFKGAERLEILSRKKHSSRMSRSPVML